MTPKHILTPTVRTHRQPSESDLYSAEKFPSTFLLWHFLAREENNSAETKLKDKNIVHVLSAFGDKNHRKLTHTGREQNGEGLKETEVYISKTDSELKEVLKFVLYI